MNIAKTDDLVSHIARFPLLYFILVCNPLLPAIDDILHLLRQLEDKTLFHEEFVHYLKYAMIVYKREPTVENVIEFVARFATSFQSPPKAEEEGEQGEDEEEEEEADDDHPFLSFIFNFLLEV